VPRPTSYRLVSVQGGCRLRRVSELTIEDGEWNQALLCKYFCRADVDEILKIKLSTHQDEDILAWGPDHRGLFSVQSAYKLAWDLNHHTSLCAMSRAPDGRHAVWDTVWGCPAPLRYKSLFGDSLLMV
jgi:hypothetical protein